MFSILSKKNYIYYAIKYYNKNSYQGTWTFFYSDIKIFSRISKYIMSRKNGKDSKQYISAIHILNNIIYLSNIYDIIPLSRLLFFICDKDTHSVIKTCLYFLYKCPVEIPETNLNKIPFDDVFLAELKMI